MPERQRRAALFAFLLGAAYVIQQTGQHATDLLTEAGSFYECDGTALYNGAECVTRMASFEAPPPPCPIGWEQTDRSCHWKGMGK